MCKRLASFVVGALLPLPLIGQDIASSMQSFFGKSVQGYQWLTEPASDLGVGSAFQMSPAGSLRALCRTFQCLGMERPTLEIRWLLVAGGNLDEGGYSDAACHGPLEESLRGRERLVDGVLLRYLLRSIDLPRNAAVSEVKLAFDSACRRTLDAHKVSQYLETVGEEPRGLREAARRNELALIVSDILLTQVHLSFKTTDPELLNKLAAYAGKDALNVLVLRNYLAVRRSRLSRNEFELELLEPLIVAVRAAQQPRGNLPPAAESGWKGWTTAHLTLPVSHSTP